MKSEESLLSDLLHVPLQTQLLAEHEAMRLEFLSMGLALESNGKLGIDDVRDLASMLRAHIRWQERVVCDRVPEEIQKRQFNEILRHERDCWCMTREG